MFRTLPVFCILLACGGCKRGAEVQSDVSADVVTAMGAKPVGFHLNPKFPDGDSIMVAARRLLSEPNYVALSRFWIGSDADYKYVVFFTGWEIKGHFESIYHRYVIFAKKKADRDWSNARGFLWPGDHVGAFHGPMALLEEKGEELGKKPNKSPQRNAGAEPANSDEASAPHRASPSENTVRTQPPRG